MVSGHGVGITDNGHYEGVDQTFHDYSNMWSSDGSHKPASVCPIQYDPNDNPPDMYAVTWITDS